MSLTFILPEYDILVTVPQGLKKEQILLFHPFNSWVRNLTMSLALRSLKHPFQNNTYRLRSITIQHFETSDQAHLDSVKLTSDISNNAGHSLHGSVLLRRPIMALMVILVPDDNSDERYVLLTVRPHIPAGNLDFVELLAETDNGGRFSGTAVQMIKEELGLEIPTQLKCMNELIDNVQWEILPSSTMYSSPGVCDEHIRIFFHEHLVQRSKLNEWKDRFTGSQNQEQWIRLKLVKMENLWCEGVRDTKCLASVALWEGLRRQGKL